MAEIWDAYGIDGKITGTLLERGKPIPEGLFHLVVEIMVQHQDGSFLFVKRHPDKATYANYFEVSAGGSALSGETPEEAAKRELYEETGLVPTTLQFLEAYFDRDDPCYFQVFHALVGNPKDAIRLQPEETVSYEWIPKAQIDSFMEANPIVPWQKKRLLHYLNTNR